MSQSSEPIPAAASNTVVARNASYYFISQVLSWCVTFFSISLIPRRLGEEIVGGFNLVSITVSSLVTVFLCGVDQFVVTEVARDRDSGGRRVGNLVAFRLLTIPLLWALALGIMWLNHERGWVFRLTMLTLISSSISMLTMPFRCAMAGMDQARRTALYDVLMVSAPLWGLPWLHLGPFALVIPGIFLQLGALIIVSRLVRMQMNVRIRFEMDQTWELLRGGIPFMVNDFAIALYGFSAVWILRKFAGPASVGEYAQSQRLFGTFLFIPTALSNAIVPTMVRLYESGHADLRKLQMRVLNALLAMALPVAALMFCLAHPFTRLLYGPGRFEHVPVLLQIAAFNMLPIYIVSITYRFLIAERKNAVWSIVLFATAALHAVLSVVLIPAGRTLFGHPAAGTTAATFAAESVAMIFAFRILRWNPLNAETMARVGRSFIATAIMVMVMMATRRMFVLIPATLGVVTILIASARLKVLGAEDQEKIADLVRRKLGRFTRTAAATAE
jgi:O-antigen/teichoic acid export membrane protein